MAMRDARELFGFLNLSKPPGITSRDVVNQVQRLVRPAKVGHAGTLDPLATGVLVVGLGQATRLIKYVQQAPKQYRAEFLLGWESDTDDVEGTLRQVPPDQFPDPAAVRRCLSQFVGTISQVPPAYSALKVQGERAYRLARQGVTPQLAARPVEIYALQLLQYEPPRLELDIECGSGTYVRALGRDLAQALGTCAVMSALVRTAVGPFRLSEACSPEHLTAENLTARLRPAAEAVAHLPCCELTEEEARRLRNGQVISSRQPYPVGEVAAFEGPGELLGILTCDGRLLRPEKICSAASRQEAR